MANDKATVDHTYEDWYKTISGYERQYKRWEARADRIVKKYKDDSRYDRNPNARFNILWSNVQTIQPAIFARLPRPDVSRRFRDNDPIGRVASMMLERALEFEIEHYGDYKSAMNNAVLDRLLGGRGVSWVRYEPHFAVDEVGEPDDGFQVTEDSDEAETLKELSTNVRQLIMSIGKSLVILQALEHGKKLLQSGARYICLALRWLSDLVKNLVTRFR
jgi:hypothetical protein